MSGFLGGSNTAPEMLNEFSGRESVTEINSPRSRLGNQNGPNAYPPFGKNYVM